MQSTDTNELSRREREIALAYADGASHREIGARLFIAPSTVRTHIGTIYRKLGVSSKIALHRALNAAQEAAPLPTVESPAYGPSHRASVAILPFRRGAGGRDALADGLVQDIITRLSKLRGVRVMARGSVFALADRGVGEEEAGRLLEVDYVATGSVQRTGDRVVIAVELIERCSGQVLWADGFACRDADLFVALEEIGDRIVACVASEIEAAERNRAILKPPESLGAWESFHRGLWHMYRFTDADNQQAQALFRRAVEMDPTFSRPYAGLSFTHFQNAFLLRPGDRAREVAQALEAAGEGLVADERDPTAHCAMGRALWLRGADAEATAELQTSVALSPSFSLGHYALAFVNSQSGDAAAAIDASDHARTLSPFDPLLFAMLGSRALALFRLGAYEEAATFAASAAERPNSHIHIRAIAALCLAAADRLDEARTHSARILGSVPGYTVDDFMTAFRFPTETQALFRGLAGRVGLA